MGFEIGGRIGHVRLEKQLGRGGRVTGRGRRAP